MTAANRKIACITMVYNEAEFLPLWVSHYGRHAGIGNLYIIDDGSTDGSTDIKGPNVIKIPKLPFSDARRASFIGDLQKSLLNYYDVVIYTDADEFLVPDPAKYASLAQYCDLLEHENATAVGLNVYHVPSEEPGDLNWSEQIFKQRRFVRFLSAMCKTLITRTPTRWGTGFHRSSPGPRIDKDLYLFHLKYVDQRRSFARQEVTRNIEWDAVALQLKQGNHQRQSDEWLKSHLAMNTRLAGTGPAPFSFSDELAMVEAGRHIDSKGLETVGTNVLGPMTILPERFIGTL